MNTTPNARRRMNRTTGVASSSLLILVSVSTAVAMPASAGPTDDASTSGPVDVGAVKHGNIEVHRPSDAAGSVPACPRTADAIVAWLSAKGPNACKSALRDSSP
jgi:hypothetical protein